MANTQVSAIVRAVQEIEDSLGRTEMLLNLMQAKLVPISVSVPEAQVVDTSVRPGCLMSTTLQSVNQRIAAINERFIAVREAIQL